MVFVSRIVHALSAGGVTVRVLTVRDFIPEAFIIIFVVVDLEPFLAFRAFVGVQGLVVVFTEFDFQNTISGPVRVAGLHTFRAN